GNSCPDCVREIGVCYDCCHELTPPPPELVADLGEGGWTDNECDACDDFAGEFTLKPLVSPATNQEIPCNWSYRHTEECEFTQACKDQILDPPLPDTCFLIPGGGWEIRAYLEPTALFATTCRWKLRIQHYYLVGAIGCEGACADSMV